MATEEAHITILDSNYSVCMPKNCKDTIHTRHITRRVIFLEMVKNAKFNIYTGIREFCKWQTFKLRMLGRMV